MINKSDKEAILTAISQLSDNFVVETLTNNLAFRIDTPFLNHNNDYYVIFIEESITAEDDRLVVSDAGWTLQDFQSEAYLNNSKAIKKIAQRHNAQLNFGEDIICICEKDQKQIKNTISNVLQVMIIVDDYLLNYSEKNKNRK